MNTLIQGYRPRLIDEMITKYLKIFGAISIEGPKWCGKTWTGLNHANSVTYLTEFRSRNLAEVDPRYVFSKDRPQLLDEWQIVPELWDAVRHECDRDQERGKFILTGSTTLTKSSDQNRIFHSGAGRIASIRMWPMSLWESGDSTGEASLQGMLEGHIKEGFTGDIELIDIARLLVRGGWPANIGASNENLGIIPKEYIETIINKDMHDNYDRMRNPRKMRMLLRALARHESSPVGNQTLLKDIEEEESSEERIESRATIATYASILEKLYITADQEAFSLNYRSSARIGKSAKRHLVDPSLSCVCLGLTPEKLMDDHKTFGFMFEALAERDLRIYAGHHGGHLYHFRDNLSGDEVDAIIEFQDGSYAAFEIKLSERGIQDALASLKKFYGYVRKKPAFMCVIVGHLSAVMRDPDTGIFVVPLTTMRP